MKANNFLFYLENCLVCQSNFYASCKFLRTVGKLLAMLPYVYRCNTYLSSMIIEHNELGQRYVAIALRDIKLKTCTIAVENSCTNNGNF